MKFNCKCLLRDVSSVFLITYSGNILLAMYCEGKVPIKSFALTNIFCVVLGFTVVGLINREMKLNHIIQVIVSCWFISISNVILFNMTWKTWFFSLIPLIILSSLGIFISRALLPDKYEIL